MSSARPTSATDRLTITLAMALGAILLAFRLDWQAYWWDEEVTLMFTRVDWFQLMIADWGLDTHRPVYYGLQKAWNIVFGETMAAVRALPGVVMLLSVPLVWQIGREIAPDDRPGPLAAVSVALLVAAPMFIAQGREIRMYCLLNLFLTLALLLALRMARASLEGASTGRLARLTTGFALSLAAAFYAQSIAVFVALLLLVWAVAAVAAGWLPRRFLWLVAAAAGLFSLAIIPALLPFFGHYTQTLGGSFWVPDPTPGYIYQQTTGAYPYPKWTKPVVGLMLLWGFWSLRHRPLHGLALALVVIGLPATVLAVSFVKPIYMTRVIAWGSLMSVIVLAAGLVALRPPALRAAGLAVLMIAQAGALSAFYPAKPGGEPFSAFADPFAGFDPARDRLVLGNQLLEPGLRWSYPQLFVQDSYAFLNGDRNRNVIDAAFRSTFLPRDQAARVPLADKRLFVLQQTVTAKPVPPGNEVTGALEVVRAGRTPIFTLRADPYRLDIYDPRADSPAESPADR